MNKRACEFLLLPLIIIVLLLNSCVLPLDEEPVDEWHGFSIVGASGWVLEEYQGKTDVLKLSPGSASNESSHGPLRYYLPEDLQGKPVNISLSASIWIEGGGPLKLVWQGHVTPEGGSGYAVIAGNWDNQNAGEWITTTGTNVPAVVMTGQTDCYLWLENENGIKGRTVYISGLSVSVEEIIVPPDPIAVSGVTVSPETLELTAGGTHQLTAVVEPSNAANKAVSWISSAASVAQVSQDGLVTALSAGTATITVTTEDGGKTAASTVTVIEEPPIAVSGVTVSPETLELTAGGTRQLTAVVEPSNAVNKAVTWTSSAVSVAQVSQDGLVTALSAGTATITVTTEDGGKTAASTVTVIEEPPIAVSGVSLNKQNLTLTIGSSEQLIANVSPPNAADKRLVWSSSSPSVAEVSPDGKVKAVNFSDAASGSGNATITVTTVDGSKTAVCTVTATVNAQVSIDSLPPIKDAFKDYFVMGNIFNPQDVSGGTLTNNRLKTHFSVLTPENNMKPDQLSPNKGSYNYSAADTMIQAARSAGLSVHGHTLIWHSQIPQWMKNEAALDRDTVLQDMKNYITAVMTHFQGKLVSWDVVNEAFPDNVSGSADWKNSMRKGASGEGQDANPWYVALGSDFVYEAFLAARKADPDVKLYYNDYNMDMQNKAQLVHNMVRDINNRYKTEHPEANGRLLIEGIGMQAHYNTGTSVANVRRSLELFKSLGVEMAISELDILAQTWSEYSANAGGPNPSGFMTQAKLYGELFSLFKEYSGTIKRVTLWGIADGQSWRSRGKPLIFDDTFRAKPAYYRIMETAD